MTYAEACDATVPREEAEREVRAHGGTTDESRSLHWAAFLAENGDRPTYDGAAVLDWLGY